MTFLFGTKSVVYYRIVYVIAFFLASFQDTTIIWTLSGITIAVMTLPNLVGILWLRKDMKNTISEYGYKGICTANKARLFPQIGHTTIPQRSQHDRRIIPKWSRNDFNMLQRDPKSARDGFPDSFPAAKLRFGGLMVAFPNSWGSVRPVIWDAIWGAKICWVCFRKRFSYVN